VALRLRLTADLLFSAIAQWALVTLRKRNLQQQRSRTNLSSKRDSSRLIDDENARLVAPSFSRRRMTSEELRLLDVSPCREDARPHSRTAD
jgi:hypothetical protein